MRNLFNFIIRNSHWLLATLLVTFGFYLVFTHNSYQRSVYFTSANHVTGWFYSLSRNVTSFFHLRKNNRLLLERNAELEGMILALREQIASLAAADSADVNIFVGDSLSQPQFGFIPAEVVNLNFSGVNNFITINKGALHGIKSDMGVISAGGGVVGVISVVSPKFSLVIPIINSKFRLSARLKNSENYGSISWDGASIGEVQLQELPKHEDFHAGDTVLTSFSRIFPRNLIIGFVSTEGHSKDDNFNTFNVRPATDFYMLQDVLVIDDAYYGEQKQLEETLHQ
ncbi:MAG: rod shape-determining protein MreC [Proteiniphilum sp.]|jgi:rod shape-determining protein MreC|nr:rod shape-determining protein MreC [Proteiniphilum sp.]